MSKPSVRLEPVLTPRRGDPKAPDNMMACFYGTVLHEDGRFRMWYYACHFAEGTAPLGAIGPGDARQGPACYAESDDGIRWTRPDLGQFEFMGTKNNNGIQLPLEKYPGSTRAVEGITLIKDEQDPDPKRRYKLLYNPRHKVRGRESFTVRGATSADGLHWTAAPEIAVESFMEQGSFYKHNGLYIVNGQSASLGEAGRFRGRQGNAFVSPDFDNWVEAVAESFLLPDPPGVKQPEDLNSRPNWGQAQRGPDESAYDQVHLGVGATSFGSVVVGLYGLWHQRGWGEGGTTADLGLVLSHDGLFFEEPVIGHVYISHKDSPVTPMPGRNYPNILCQGNGILNVGDQTLIYHGRWRNADEPSPDNYCEIALATLPRDRWGALGLNPGATEGAVWSAPIRLPAATTRILLNADGTQDMRVEIADDRFSLHEGYSGDNSGTASLPAGLDCPVTWPKGDLSKLAGKTIRLRISFDKKGKEQSRLYAVYLRAK